MDTFDLLPSLADGDLAESSAPELVAAIFRSRASGTLTIDAPESGEVRQFFRAGQMCGSAYFTGFHTLAQVLLEQEWAQALDVDETLAEAQAKGLRHGAVLLERGLLTEEQLAQALGAQHRHNLMALMRIDRGHYELRGWEPPPQWTRELNIDPLGPLFDALEEPRLVHRRAHLLDWLGPSPVRLTPDWAEMAPKALIGSLDHRAISQLSLARTRGEFLAVSKLKPARAEALLIGLLLIGAAEPKQTAPISNSRPPPVTDPNLPRSAPPPQRISDPNLQRSAPPPQRSSDPNLQRSAPPPQRNSDPSLPRTAPPPQRASKPPAQRISTPQPQRRVPPQPTRSTGDVFAAHAAEEDSPFESSALGNERRLNQAEEDALHNSRIGDRRRHHGVEEMALESEAPLEAAPLEAEEVDESSLPEAVLASNPGVEKKKAAALQARQAQELHQSQSRQAQQSIDEEILLAIGENVQPESGFEEPASRALAPADEVEVLPDSEAFAIESPSIAGSDLRKKLRARGLRNMADASREVSQEIELDLAPMAENRKLYVETPISREAQRLLDEVQARVRALPMQNPWQRLGVSQKATNEQIHTAYLEGVKRYHPDRASALGITDAQEDFRTIFAAIKEAHEKIGTAVGRERNAVASTSSPGGGGSPRQEEASLALQMGDVLLRKRDFPGAMIKFRRAAELAPNGDTLAALAWGLLCDPASSPAHRSEAEMLIDRALRAGGATARTHYVAGVSWRQRDPNAAGEAFKKALELDPNHRAASQELRLLELRQAREPKKK